MKKQSRRNKKNSNRDSKNLEKRIIELESKKRRNQIFTIIGLGISLLAIIATLSTNSNRIWIAEKSGKFDKPDFKVRIGDHVLKEDEITTIMYHTRDKFENFDFVRAEFIVENIGSENLTNIYLTELYSQEYHKFCEGLELDSYPKDELTGVSRIVKTDQSNRSNNCIIHTSVDKIIPKDGRRIFQTIPSPSYEGEHIIHKALLKVGADNIPRREYIIGMIFFQTINNTELENSVNLMLSRDEIPGQLIINKGEGHSDYQVDTTRLLKCVEYYAI